MKKNNDTGDAASKNECDWLAIPPTWPLIQAYPNENNLSMYWDMTSKLDSSKFGDVLDHDEFTNFFI